jgi:ketosteroid isomerase-like protein
MFQVGSLIMNTQDVATAFTALLQAGEHEKAGLEYWAANVRSVEAMDGPMASIEGVEAVIAKGEWWYANNEVHSVETVGPFVNGNQFAVTFKMDITDKASGNRMVMDEIGLYTVEGGKIVEERFFYGT